MRWILSIFLFYFSFLVCDETHEGLILDLKDPILTDGILSTEAGGVIQGLDVRIQAQKIIYTKKTSDTEVCFLYAEGNLILEFGGYYFIGEALEYDFLTHTGTLYQARTSLEPWYFGGDVILLHADGSFTLYDGFVTTSESRKIDWVISAERAHLSDKRFFFAENVKFKIHSVPFMWVPSLKADLDSIFDSPLRYNFKWGSHQGARVSLIYEFFSWQRFKAFARLDYRIKRGLGGGIETHYENEKEIFNTINYVAHDNSLANSHEKFRYRFQGLYHNLVWDDRVSIDLTWDKLSDIDMATDYNDRGLELDTAGRTQFTIRKQEKNRIERLVTYVRVNSFQSVDQELPTFELTWRPFILGKTGIISTTLFRTSYLDFAYANDVLHVHDYSSSRLEYRQGFHRAIPCTYFTLTPRVGFCGIYYGNSPQHNSKLLSLFRFGLDAKTSFVGDLGSCKHVIEPYMRFQYFTSPTVSPDHHYIFDIEDGYYQENQLRLGVTNQFFFKNSYNCLTRSLFLDLYTYGFFDIKTIGSTFPKAYLDLTSLPTPYLRLSFNAAWDFQHHQVDYFNFLTEWTVSETLAIRSEYRHRSSYFWRKADPTNFILDAYRSENELLHSPLSDRRDTLLTSLFYQFNPNWALFFEMRHGWNRKYEPSYTEFETDLLLKLPSAWNFKLSYQHKENDDRIAFYFTIGLHKPNQNKCMNLIPRLEL